MESGDNQPSKFKEKTVICPLCHGTGQIAAKNNLPPIENCYSKTYDVCNISEPKLKSTGNGPKLPLIKQRSPVPEFDKTKEEKEQQKSRIDKESNTIKKQYFLKPQSAHLGGDNQFMRNGDYIELLPPPITLRNPAEAVKYAMLQLNNGNWEIIMQGLGTLVQVSRDKPNLIEPHMTKVNQTLCNSLHTIRTQVARFACQAAKELFRTMQSTKRPEFDEIVESLLQKTADMNKYIRHDANEALDAMITFVPPVSSVRAIVNKGPTHKNALVRTTVARLLVCVVTMVEVHCLFTLPAYKETRKRIFDAAAILLYDSNIIVRNSTKLLFKMLIKDKNFDSLFYTEVNKKLLKKIDKALVCLKYEIRERIRK